ncbi:hypothetical protein C8R44DRAFT_903475 [Mycena epipterygia]|nr:hypothetical protein C8R44DRAFT_903475 [Mycena epipterygia]
MSLFVPMSSCGSHKCVERLRGNGGAGSTQHQTSVSTNEGASLHQNPYTFLKTTVTVKKAMRYCMYKLIQLPETTVSTTFPYDDMKLMGMPKIGLVPLATIPIARERGYEIRKVTWNEVEGKGVKSDERDEQKEERREGRRYRETRKEEREGEGKSGNGTRTSSTKTHLIPAITPPPLSPRPQLPHHRHQHHYQRQDQDRDPARAGSGVGVRVRVGGWRVCADGGVGDRGKKRDGCGRVHGVHRGVQAVRVRGRVQTMGGQVDAVRGGVEGRVEAVRRVERREKRGGEVGRLGTMLQRDPATSPSYVVPVKDCEEVPDAHVPLKWEAESSS